MSNWFMKTVTGFAMNRPDAALVKMAGGAPRTVGGRTLDARFQFIEAQARRQSPGAPTKASIGRKQTDMLVYLFGGKPEAGVTWQDTTIPSSDAGRTIPVRIYKPAQIDASMPALTWFHFGGGVVGNVGTSHAFCTILANELKAPVVSVEYRLAPEHQFPAGLNDSIDGYLWTAENGAKLGAAAGKAAIGGDSMGGNFSAVISQEMRRRGKPMPVVQLLVYPATDIDGEHDASMTEHGNDFPLTRDMMQWFMDQLLPAGTDRRSLLLSPIHERNLAGLPPALVYTAGFDPLVDQGKRYADALQKAGVKTTYRCYDSLAHGFTAFTGAIPAADRACREMARETAAMMRA